MRVGTAASIARDESGFTRLDFVSRYRTRSPKFLVTAALNCPWRCCSRWLGHCLRTRKWSSRISRLTRAQNSSPRFEGDGPARPWACRVGLKVLQSSEQAEVATGGIEHTLTRLSQSCTATPGPDRTMTPGHPANPGPGNRKPQGEHRAGAWT